MTYRKGYFKALLDVLHFMESLENVFIKSHAERWKVAIAVIREVLGNNSLDYFMENGGEIEFKYHYEKGKAEIEQIGGTTNDK